MAVAVVSSMVPALANASANALTRQHSGERHEVEKVMPGGRLIDRRGVGEEEEGRWI